LTVVVPWHILPSKKGERGDAEVVDTFLTLVIALGGIATGIGAIWMAVAARHQAQLTERSLTEQRQFLKEQTEIARRQAEVTQRSLAEQNERARFTLEYDLLSRLGARYDTPQFRRTRSAAAKHLLDNAFAADDIVEVGRLNAAVWVVLDFFEELGYLLRMQILRADSVRNNFGWYAQAYWLLCRPAVEKAREEWQDPTLYEETEHLSRLMTDIERERSVAPPTQRPLREVMEHGAVVGE
jgi:hypothetical protein